MSNPGLAQADPLDTFPRLLRHHATVRPAKAAVREKEFGIWQTYTWADAADNVRALACGLAELGFKRGDRLAIVGDNRPRLYWAICAAQALGGIPVPMYQDAVAQEMAFVMADAEIRFALAEDQEQVDKLLDVQATVPVLRHILYDDTRGMRHYAQAGLMSLDELQRHGHARHQREPQFYELEVAKGAAADTAIMLYTSGTTGTPKGVMLSHANLLLTAKNAAEFDGLTEHEEILSYLPMAWVGDNIFSCAQAYVTGFCINCPESSETVMTDLREIGPTYYFAPPRVFENLLTSVMIRMEDAGAIKRRLFHHFMAVAKRVGPQILDGLKVGLLDRLHYGLGQLLVYGPLRNVLGFSRVRVGYTAGEAIGPEIFSFYRSLGINLKQLYGQTEGCVFICMQPHNEVFADTVGPAAPGVEIRIADNGEVLYRGPGVFQAYFKNPESTASTKTPDGWVHTGDAGYFDARGHLKIIDRAKDVGRLTDGNLFAPKYIENKLKFFPNIKEAVAFGDGRGQVCAFINIDISAVGNWAERRNLAYAGYTDLAGRPEVYGLICECVEQVNADLAADEKMAACQIHRFLILHKELDADDGELTRTRKVRRRFIEEKYGTLIAALYDEAKTSCFIETQVKYEDGRSGVISADLKIEAAKVFAPGGAKRAA
ncbi:AMP-binding protein [Niveibacterium umoris]|uniref:Long-chain acyl-CoA synthetase n=1 Tax=Niveibacterium umoris TaxID=1193620 RepID=A0A840BPX3_9RHOO|nr:AMP-binding protein [Niveibacterium umoris]MBB4013732.1 long-chain acyl-CoA synthetase [Niveibacterium umoris]